MAHMNPLSVGTYPDGNFSNKSVPRCAPFSSAMSIPRSMTFRYSPKALCIYIYTERRDEFYRMCVCVRACAYAYKCIYVYMYVNGLPYTSFKGTEGDS